MPESTDIITDAHAAALDALAEAAGVERTYSDIYGLRHEASPSALIALLGAMDLPAATAEEARRSVERLENDRWSRTVPPVTVLRQGPEPAVPLALPEQRLDAALPWHLRLEDGTERHGEAQPGDLVVEERGDRNDVPMVRLRLPLPADLPLGYHRLDLGPETDDGGSLVVAPPQCYLPPVLEDGGRVWGVGCQLYALRSATNWGIGDFGDLAKLAGDLGRQGGATVGLNPLHALFPNRPGDASPYSPNSRLFLNPLYIALPQVPEFPRSVAVQQRVAQADTQEVLQRCRVAALVDYPHVAHLKRPLLELLFDTFEADADRDRHAAFETFVAEGGARLRLFALFQALQEAHPGLPWPQWPEALRSPESPAVEAFARDHPRLIRLHLWMQFEADRQLGAAARALADTGAGIGLYRDLAVGANPDGADTWMDPQAYVRTARFGAPPDDLGPMGQDWGLPPLHPHGLRHSAYGPFIDMLRANMRHAGALRIDHAMALQHLFWIPPGKDATEGIYVSYPMDDLMGILALESHRNRCLVIGEDLGTVPDGFRERMLAENILSYRVLYFERYDSGLFKRPDAYPVQALATATSHDMATIPGHWEGWDIALRHRLGLTHPERTEDADQAARDHDREALVGALQDQDLLPRDFPTGRDLPPNRLAELTLACHRFLARTPSRVMLVNIDDLAGEVTQVNVPGTVDEYPNWSRRLGTDLDELMHGPAMTAMARALADDRG